MTFVRARPSLQPQPWRRGVRAPSTRRRLLAALLVGVAAAGLPSPVIASAGGGRQITDAENTRTVYLVVTALVLLAIGLAVFTWWFWRSTRREHESLAPLEVMGDRKFVAADTLARQVMLDGNRPVGAAPLAPGAPEPLMVSPFDDAEVDAAPATLVVAAVADAAAPSVDDDSNGPATTVVAESPAVSGDATAVLPIAGEPTADVDAEMDAELDLDAELDPDAEPGATETRPDATVTQAVAATESVAPPETVAVTATVQPPATVAATGNARTPIDPGLPVPPADEEPPRHLSLAELAALHSDAPIGFDDGELASTPSTGIPVIESAEAWLQRQLAAASGSASTNGHSDTAEPDDPDEPRPAAVRGAE